MSNIDSGKHLEPSPDATHDVLATVRRGYGAIAAARGPNDPAARVTSEHVGYRAQELASVPSEANLGLGCGNPTAFAMIRPGDTVLDLGSGGGLDAFLAANVVGETGRVIGVDTTPEMLASARASAVKAGVAHRVEFREGVIEELPVASRTVDVILSNCVINLSTDKPRVFREAFRVLKSGGRLAVSDLALSAPLPEDLAAMAATHLACLGGATVIDIYLDALRAAGFVDLEIDRTSAASTLDVLTEDPLLAPIIQQIGEDRLREVASTVWSYRVTARRPEVGDGRAPGVTPTAGNSDAVPEHRVSPAGATVCCPIASSAGLGSRSDDKCVLESIKSFFRRRSK